MNEYFVYWIKEEFASHYFYKNDILYRFFMLYQRNKERQDLYTQYNFITNKFPKYTIITHLKKLHPNHVYGNIHGDQLEISYESYHLTLHFHEKYLKFYCKNLNDAEELLFSTLRLFQPFLFVIGNKNDTNYGWISPVTKNRKYNNGQVLYAYQ